jgi:hypothetical protein
MIGCDRPAVRTSPNIDSEEDRPFSALIQQYFACRRRRIDLYSRGGSGIAGTGCP